MRLDHLELSQRHIREATAIIDRQRQLIAGLRSRRLDSAAAENVLAIFEDTLNVMEAHGRLIARG